MSVAVVLAMSSPGRIASVLARYLLWIGASWFAWRVTQRLIPRLRDQRGATAPTGRVRVLVLAGRSVLAVEVALLAGGVLSILLAPVALPLLLWAHRAWLDAGRLLRGLPVRGSWLEIWCWIPAAALVVPLALAALTAREDATAENLAAWAVLAGCAWVQLQVALLARRHRSPEARTGCGGVRSVQE